MRRQATHDDSPRVFHAGRQDAEQKMGSTPDRELEDHNGLIDTWQRSQRLSRLTTLFLREASPRRKNSRHRQKKTSTYRTKVIFHFEKATSPTTKVIRP
ncbi:hypothetical protein MTO96_007393 [Rhipicephalus appendiculatus]